MSTCFYTAILDNTDSLPEYNFSKGNDEYIVFTDNPELKSNFFKIIYVDRETNDPARESRKYKVLPHKYLLNSDLSVWFDASFLLTENFSNIVELLQDDQYFMAIKHPERDCVYDEAELCKSARRDDPRVIDKQIQKYKTERYPKNNGLIAGGLLVRRHNQPDCIKLDELWWKEISENSRRDQLSLVYVAWKHKLNIQQLDMYLWDNEYFQVKPHIKIQTFEDSKQGFLRTILQKVKTGFKRG